MYNDKAKERTMRYIKDKRDFIHLNIPKGNKERYKRHAESKGKSLTALIVDLVEDDIQNSGKPVPDGAEREENEE